MGIHTIKQRAVFLDRDGVINCAVVRDGKPYPPYSKDELQIPSDVPEALARLQTEGFRLMVVTNQPDVARGIQTRAGVEGIHQAILDFGLPIDSFRVCYHDDCDDCDCRKPKPGMLIDVAREQGLVLGDCFMVGDRWRDIAAGRQAGCKTILIDYDYDEIEFCEPHVRVHSLSEAVDWILTQSSRKVETL